MSESDLAPQEIFTLEEPPTPEETAKAKLVLKKKMNVYSFETDKT